MASDNWHLAGNSRLVPIDGERFVMLWSEAGPQAYRLRSQLLNFDLVPVGNLDAISLPRKHLCFDAVALPGGGFVRAWEEHNIVFMERHDVDGSSLGTVKIGQTANVGRPVHLAAFPDGQIAIGCSDFLSILSENRLTLCLVSPNAWHHCMAYLNDNRVVRVELVHRVSDYNSVPVFELQGRMVDPCGATVSDFLYNVPATIVGDSYAHPDDLAVAAIASDRFVVVWTQLGHQLANSIEAQIFDHEGKPIGDRLIVDLASSTSSVNNPSVIATMHSGFAIAWSENKDPAHTHKFQFFDNDGTAQGSLYAHQDVCLAGRSAVQLTVGPPGKITTHWIEGGDILFGQISFHPK